MGIAWEDSPELKRGRAARMQANDIWEKAKQDAAARPSASLAPERQELHIIHDPRNDMVQLTEEWPRPGKDLTVASPQLAELTAQAEQAERAEKKKARAVRKGLIAITASFVGVFAIPICCGHPTLFPMIGFATCLFGVPGFAITTGALAHQENKLRRKRQQLRIAVGIEKNRLQDEMLRLNYAAAQERELEAAKRRDEDTRARLVKVQKIREMEREEKKARQQRLLAHAETAFDLAVGGRPPAEKSVIPLQHPDAADRALIAQVEQSFHFYPPGSVPSRPVHRVIAGLYEAPHAEASAKEWRRLEHAPQMERRYPVDVTPPLPTLLPARRLPMPQPLPAHPMGVTLPKPADLR